METTFSNIRPVRLPEAIYQNLAEQINDNICKAYDGDPEETYKSDDIEYTNGAFTAVLSLSIFIYRRIDRAPDGDTHPITDIEPVWSELHTYLGGEMEEVVNDFDFKKLKKYIC